MDLVLSSKYFYILLTLAIFYLLYVYKECKKIKVLKTIRLAQIEALKEIYSEYVTTIPSDIFTSVVNAVKSIEAEDGVDDDSGLEINIGKKEGEENENSQK